MAEKQELSPEIAAKIDAALKELETAEASGLDPSEAPQFESTEPLWYIAYKTMA
jgi:hypothetical protein